MVSTNEDRRTLNINANKGIIKKFRHMHTKWQDFCQDQGISKKETTQRDFLEHMLKLIGDEIGVKLEDV